MPRKAAEKKEAVPVAEFLVNKIVVAKDYEELLEKAYGKVTGSNLELSFVEALYLLENGRIQVKKDNKVVPFNKLLAAGLQLDKRLHERYIVYDDLRERGLTVKTGFKFGCDFRVYRRGVGVKKGPKAAGEHTRWIVSVVPEDYTCSFHELSRAVRLAHSIRARMLWAVVDSENNVIYYEILRLKP
ncbi:MAG: tRNA-intron lyase [Candidatus Aenigmatarchaeota archaeon]|nr:MAG: tRNA-intron lyase [Candidatus Aenigmarchaeota archaeon]